MVNTIAWMGEVIEKHEKSAQNKDKTARKLSPRLKDGWNAGYVMFK